ncbi:MAG: TonB-dependent receptor [Gammaproteobacteria bacterium]|nr:TonB-dependent receptor [Gammaproteobacteria bacterium]MBU1409179.1 TonB-dependent receptor [Gammaproteobacteria bacterium]MBU1531075.1 TonB-dependent receptor [Gammaproteobacteria bacterium]
MGFLTKAIAGFPRSISSVLVIGIALGTALPIQAAAESNPPDAQTDLTHLSIEELLSVEVYSASKFTQKTTEAPSAVTIITAADIKAYGYRTLADVLRSVRGMDVAYDRTYSYLGVRGSGRSGDYNSRVLLLLDGYRLNDPVYDQASIGSESLVDVDLIDRIEIVRGPGSSIYGSNAVLGVISITTKRGNDIDGLEASGELASFGTDKERLSYGKRYENGAELLLSASRYRSRGQDLFFPEYDTPITNNGIARNLDGDRYDSFFGKLAYAGFTLTGGYSSRDKAVPTAFYSTLFNDPHTEFSDGSAFVDLAYYGGLDQRWDISAHVFRGSYSFDGIYPYAVALNKDETWGAWWGTEVKLVGRLQKHKVVVGAEYQDNFRQDQINFDIAPYALYLDDRRNSTRTGVYVQDEISLSRSVRLNAGLRFDDYSTVGGTLNPRLGLIWNPVAATTLKLLYGTAFRAPNAYELYYAAAGTSKANPDLDPEEITTYEFVIEHQVLPNFRLTADAYFNRISNNINLITDPVDGLQVFTNAGEVDARGIELEAERQWDGGTRLRTSYAWQISSEHETGATLVNSPRHLAKFNFSAPVWGDILRAGAELQYASSRKTLAGGTVGGHLLANLTLLSEKLTPGMTLSASIYNLFDKRYADPGGEEHLPIDAIQQDGRNYRLKLNYRF